MTFSEFVAEAEKNYRINARAGGLRRGQAYFNVLNEVNSSMADRLRGGSNDPFYNDTNLGEFLGYVALYWGDV